MNRLSILLFAASQLPLAAQQIKPENILSPTTRLYQPKYLSPQRGHSVANFVHSVVPSVTIYWEPVVKGLVLQMNIPGGWKDGTENPLDKAEELIKRFDVPEPPQPPEREIDMTISLIRACEDAARCKGAVPSDLADVVKEMKGALPYAGFSPVDNLQVKVRDGLEVEDALPSTNPPAASFYRLEFKGPSISPDGKTVTVGHFRFGIKVPIMLPQTVNYQDESIATPLTITVGQKQVLGKLKFLGDDLFVVLSCKVK